MKITKKTQGERLASKYKFPAKSPLITNENTKGADGHCLRRIRESGVPLWAAFQNQGANTVEPVGHIEFLAFGPHTNNAECPQEPRTRGYVFVGVLNIETGAIE